VEAVGRQLDGADVSTDVAGFCGLLQEAFDQAVEMLLGSVDVLPSMQDRRELGAVVLVGDERVRLEYGREPLERIAVLIPDRGELLEVAVDLTLVPGDQDRLDIREVLVERRASDPGLLRDLRHGHRERSALGHQCRGGVQRRIAHRPAVCLDRLIPQLRHRRQHTLRRVADELTLTETLCLVNSPNGRRTQRGDTPWLILTATQGRNPPPAHPGG